MPPTGAEAQLAGEIEENKLYKLKKMGATADDILNVWNYVSTYISCQMQKTKGVNIIGLGTFTFIQRKTDVGNNKYLLIQRPVFVISERFAQQHQLTCAKHHLSGQVTVVDLNFSAISFESPFSRDMVEECVRDVISEFSRAISVGKNIEFTFSSLGRLSIRNRKVKMKFFKEFINSLDTSGEMMSAMRDRPGTADSVMSRSSVRPGSVNTTVLPSIGDMKSKKPCMESIDEGMEVNLDGIGNVDDPEMQKAINAMDKNGEIFMGQNGLMESGPDNYHSTGAEEMESMGLPGMLLEERSPPEVNAAKEMLYKNTSRPLAPISRAGAFSLDDITPRAFSRPVGETGRSHSGGAVPALRRSNTLPEDIGDLSSPKQFKPLSPILPSTPNQLTHRPPARDTPVHRHSSAGAPWPAEPRLITPTGSECGHNAGQELCYLCHQRAARNIPVSFDEERQKREEEEDRVLHEYQILKNNEAILQDQEKNMARRFALQKQAAFNLGVAEAVNEKKNAKPEKEPPKAYIFQRRPLTPPKYVKQNQLKQFLNDQLGAKDSNAKKERAEREFLERLEQVQLAEDLALQRDHYMKERAAEKEKYREALATQLKYKPLQVPDKTPDGEVFGKNDTTEADLLARREHARKIASEQLNTVADRKRAELLKLLQTQQEEEEKLKANKEELIADRVRRYERSTHNRKMLENEWVQAADSKKGREIEERLRTITPGGLVHEQCDKYKRCAQCKKKLGNCGETNIWKESRYIPGARIMV